VDEIEVTSGSRLLQISEAVARVLGTRLCFGDPVRQGERAVIPVASLSTTGGLGFGRSVEEAGSDGGGGGGVFGARPVGFIEISASGARFHRIVTTSDILRIAGVGVWLALRFGRARRRAAAQVVSKQP
jgi:uncharacterized spore protein YtfJ